MSYLPLPNLKPPAQEWMYVMRRSMQEIVPGLFLGPYAAATKPQLQTLLNNGISHIVCVRQDIERLFIKTNFPDHFKYLIIEIGDNQRQNIIRHIPVIRDFLDDCFAQNGKALVHGNTGTSRSASLVVGCLMQRFGISAKDAFHLVQQRRFCIQPNEAFMAQLQEYEPIYRALKEAPAITHTQPNVKRSWDEDDDQDMMDTNDGVKFANSKA